MELKRQVEFRTTKFSNGFRELQVSGHRESVGGFWEEMGTLQFDFLEQQGLQPHHFFLDIACGSLRGGVRFIDYLEPWRYLGLDKEEELILAGIYHELGMMAYEEKRPRFVISDSFEFDLFHARADYAVAISLFTHLPAALIEVCFWRLRKSMSKGGRFYATFFESMEEVENPAAPSDDVNFYYTRDQMLSFGQDSNWTAEYVGDWGDPELQKAVVYTAG